MDRQENIDFCIRYLLEQNHAEAAMAKKLREKQQVLRALMNIWEPQPLSNEFLAAQSSWLTAQLQQTADWLELQQGKINLYKALCR